MSDYSLLLCTDLDRTLLPNGAQQESPGARETFSRLAARPEVCLVYVSGRDQALVQRAIVNYLLPQPDFVITDVGTNLYDCRDQTWQLWPRWQEEIAPDWQHHSHADLQQLLSGFRSLRLQQRGKQNTYKLSYYFALHTKQASLHNEIQQTLQAAGVRASLIWSVDEPAGIGLLDILPERATKLHAVEFVREYLVVPLQDTLFAGDSGNDLPVMASAIPSVLVANAMPAVAQQARLQAEQQHNQQALYLAHGGFLQMNGNYSAGILEGISHFHPELISLMQSERGQSVPGASP